MKMLFILLIIGCFGAPAVVGAQQIHNRNILHPSVGLGENWYATVWVISNIREDLPDNINLFPGVGYRTSRWWTELLGWRQWSTVGAASAVEGRFGITHPQVLFYSELSRFFGTGDVYTFVFAEHTVWRRLSLGVETENFFREKNSLGAGPRIGYVWATVSGGPVVTTLTYQVRWEEPDVVRLYIAAHPRF